MNKKVLHERLWASLAHFPIITIIWFTYIFLNYSDAILNCTDGSFEFLTTTKLPIRPIILTLCSLPISLSLMFYKKTSRLISNNAQSAYEFNIWLLQYYLLSIALVLIGKYMHIPQLLTAVALGGVVIFALCLIESIIGVIFALQGKVFVYWYPKFLALKKKH